MLSKSKFLRGHKCPKSLWLYVNKHDEIQVPNGSVLKRGTQIGNLACAYFPFGLRAVEEGEVPSTRHVEYTQELIRKGEDIIYEATFEYDDVLVAADILKKEKDGWHIYEVKSSTHIEEYHYLDAAVQYYVISHCLDDVSGVHIMHINNEYVRKGDINVTELFVCENLTDKVISLQGGIPKQLDFFSDLECQVSEPESQEECCKKWYPCDFQGYYFPEKEHPVSLHKTVDVKEVRAFVNRFEYPVAHLDFETIQPAVPYWDNSRPYQQIPFQYSIHIQDAPFADYVHREYLAENDWRIDPRKVLITQMISDLRGVKTIFAYNCAFEKGRIMEMAEDFPEFANDLNAINSRIYELGEPFKDGFYQFADLDKGQYGPYRRWSIKMILPRINPNLSYHQLDEVHNGTEAQETFMELYDEDNPKNTPERIEKTRKNMLAYCGLDTRSMVEIWEELKKYSEN